MIEQNPERASLARYAWISIIAAILTMGLKASAYLLTGSVGLLSDAVESLVNLAGALMALAMLIIAARPADEDHAFGHNKAEYFSSGVEGTLILIAAISIGVAAVDRLLNPQPLEQLGIGLVASLGASGINLTVALVLRRAAKKFDSITLEANSQHLMTDVWTSAGVVVAMAIVAITGWEILDPVVALLVAANIIWTGVKIIRSSALGLMDTALPAEDQEIIKRILEKHSHAEFHYHALRTRQAGARKFISFHVLVPGSSTVHQGHQLLEKIEAEIRSAIPQVTIFTHLEPIEHASSWEDTKLDRPVNASEKS